MGRREMLWNSLRPLGCVGKEWGMILNMRG